MKKSRSNNPTLLSEIEELTTKSREKKAPALREIAKRLTKSASRRAEINLSKINRHTGKGEIVAIPGKVLGTGSINHPITAAAFSFSKNAEEKITAAGGRCITLSELATENPEGKKIKIIR